MSLQAVFGFDYFGDTIGKGNINAVELVPHLIGSGVKEKLNLITESVGCGTLALRVQDVVICEPCPGVRQAQSGLIYSRV